MNFYIADCHFGHAASIRFDNRPFSSVEEMERSMTANWNAAVKRTDTTFIVGDFCMSKDQDEWIRLLRQLNGQKALILGNHDIKKLSFELRREFVSVEHYTEVTDIGRDNVARKACLCHYPQLFYHHSHNPKNYMLCGHVHLSPENTLLEQWTAELRRNARVSHESHVCNLGQIYNVGVMCPWIYYTPRTLAEITRGWAASHSHLFPDGP